MSLFRIMLLLIVIITFSYILYILANKRHMIKSEMEGFAIQNTVLNPFRSDKQKMENELDGIKKTSNKGIDHFSDAHSLKLREFCMLSSYNTAISGEYVNTEMIRHTLERGFRFIDFEIFAKDDIPYVGNGTKNHIMLVEILDVITNSAFSQPCPNYKDPLFVHFRIQEGHRNDAIYKSIRTLLDNGNVKQYLYDKEVTGDTLLSSLSGKIVAVLNSDGNTSPRIDIIQMTSNRNLQATDVIRSTDYYRLLEQKPQRPTINENDMTTNQHDEQLQMVIPESNVNPALKPLVCDYCIQISGNQLSVVDNNLDICERVFNANKSAFVPLAIMIPYLESPAYADLTT